MSGAGSGTPQGSARSSEQVTVSLQRVTKGKSAAAAHKQGEARIISEGSAPTFDFQANQRLMEARLDGLARTSQCRRKSEGFDELAKNKLLLLLKKLRSSAEFDQEGVMLQDGWD